MTDTLGSGFGGGLEAVGGLIGGGESAAEARMTEFMSRARAWLSR